MKRQASVLQENIGELEAKMDKNGIKADQKASQNGQKPQTNDDFLEDNQVCRFGLQKEAIAFIHLMSVYEVIWPQLGV